LGRLGEGNAQKGVVQVFFLSFSFLFVSPCGLASLKSATSLVWPCLVTTQLLQFREVERNTEQHTETMSALDQQWDEVVLRKSGAKPKSNTQAQQQARSGGGSLDAIAKFGAGSNRQTAGPQNAAKLDAETEDFHHDTVKLDVRRRIQQGRQMKKMTQKELAQAINVKPQVINEYESGKAIPNNMILAKMERVLDVKLRGDLNKPAPKGKSAARGKGAAKRS
jgi:putative transcription factor